MHILAVQVCSKFIRVSVSVAFFAHVVVTWNLVKEKEIKKCYKKFEAC